MTFGQYLCLNSTMEKKPKILPLVWLLLALVLMAMLHWLGPFGTYLSPPWTWAGLVPIERSYGKPISDPLLKAGIEMSKSVINLENEKF